MSVLSDINQFVKIAQKAPAKSSNTTPKVMDQADFSQELKKRLAVMNDPKGWYKTQHWDKDQKDQMNSWARYINSVRKNPQATVEQQREALRLSDMLVETYGKPNLDRMMPELIDQYGDDVKKVKGGVEITRQQDVAINPEETKELREFWISQVPEDKKIKKNIDQLGVDLQRDFTVGSNGDHAVLDRNWKELAPGISIRPRMVRDQNGGVVVDPADQRVIDRYRKYKDVGSTASKRLPTIIRRNGKTYVRVNGVYYDYNTYVKSRYSRTKKEKRV